MYSYTVRIEMHSNVFLNFSLLHIKMAGEGFSRTIVADNAVEYHLPRATYVIRGTHLSLSQVLEAATRALAGTGQTGEVLVSQTSTWRWSGLAPVKR
jgi:hypothetical protein